ncbi:hypothetical protein ABD83_09825 [Bacillus xiamenensis]|uniref:C1q domain-containing protein n=1 Tax=Bacillus xiamenensis TaxID=1178537 RepID=A0ABT4F7V9_9BACI|nr:hypothetical protein [Bacillus xiamenensis]MBG9911742.1 hypothetical protein [Bacillus xiamenensis]MCY9577540.1 hypothetical protein [Bacillus xiamenensis]
MEIKEPKPFEVNDKAHADLFNDMVKVLLENDTGLLGQLTNHTHDTKSHTTEAEKKKWNESQSYKITADNGSQLINVPADARIFDAIKNKGTCTFFAAAGVEDSPTPSNISLRGIQTVGQDNIGTGFAVDIAGNAYSFYYNDGHTAINWTKLPTNTDKNKWNEGQLSKITADNGGVIISISDGEDLLEKIVSLGSRHGTFYVTGKALNTPTTRSCRGMYHFTSQDSNGKGTFGWIMAIDYNNYMYTNYLDLNLGWQGWKRVLTKEDMENTSFVDTYDQDNSLVSAAENVATKLVFGKTRADDLSEYNRSRAEITLKNSGLYLIRLYITSTNITVGSDNILACYVNGSEYQRFGNWNPATSSSTCVLYLLQKLKAGDKVTFYITPRGTSKTVSINTAYVTMSQLR